MSFDNKKLEFGKEKFELVEFDLDYCTLTFGMGACTATADDFSLTLASSASNPFTIGDGLIGVTSGAMGSVISVDGAIVYYRQIGGVGFTTASEVITVFGGAKSAVKIAGAPIIYGTYRCRNTLTTCAVTADFDKGIKTYRVCTNRSPLPIGLPTDLAPIPSIKSVSTSPAVIDIKGGLGVRSNLNVALSDLPHNDVGIDKHVDERVYNPLEVGSWGAKLRARNPEYQNRPIRYYSGYLDNGVFDYSNFQQRSYIIDSLNVSNGQIKITGKDILKLVSSKKAQAPAVNTGLTTSALTAGATSIVVDDGSGYTTGYVLIDKEVIQVTNVSTNTLTLVRGQFNTIAATHSSGVTVQQCLYYNGKTVPYIVNDLLTNFSSIDSSFIPYDEWVTNMSSFGTLTGIVVKPTDVNKLLIELTEAIPHYLWWDERGTSPYIRMTPLSAPPDNATTLNTSSNLIEVNITDDTNARVSTVFIHFGQFDPTKKLDEDSNYQQTWARVDTDSIAKYGSGEVKEIHSRWLSNINLAGAKKAATLIGRRFSDIQRKISFELDPKDSDGATGLWTGQSRNINHRDMTDFDGYPVDTMFQIISAHQSQSYKFSGIEFKYGDELADDITVTDKIVYYSSDEETPLLNVNLKEDWENLYQAHTTDSEAIFIIQTGSVIGSSSNSTYSIETDSWPSLTTGFVKIIIQSGCYVAGKAGVGANGDNTPAATNGGGALNLGVDVILEGGGVLGGGGGGGGGNDGTYAEAAGGGGAGSSIGEGGSGTNNAGGDYTITQTFPDNGTVSSGGAGATITVSKNHIEHSYTGGTGGDLGEAGTLSGGIAGKACNLNGYTLDQSGSGVTIEGAVS